MQSNNQVNDVKEYEDETHKNIKYGQIDLNFNSYHIASYIKDEKSATFKCLLDEGKLGSKNQITVTIQDIEKQDFSNLNDLREYLKDNYPDYDKIEIYNNVADDSGITSLYKVTKGDLTNYVVCYSDRCYLIKSDYSILEIALFKNFQRKNYLEDNQKIECANSYIANVKKASFMIIIKQNMLLPKVKMKLNVL